jgi:hypothetical protein
MSSEFDSHISDAELDRLVDGELSRERYRELLANLDADPDGWKRCAIAFLESQAWRGELRMAVPQQPATPRVEKPARPVRQHMRAFLSFAAGFAIAISLGLAARTPFRDATAIPEAAIRADRSQPPNGPARADAALAKPPFAPSDPTWGHLTLAIDRGDGTDQEIQLPVLRTGAIEEDLLEQVRDLPPEIIRDLQQMGYQVQRDARWESIELTRGWRVMVPLGEFEITPVSRVAY